MQYLGPYSEEYGFALVIPEGYKRSFNAKSSFCCGGALDEDVDDVGFLVDIKTNVRACVHGHDSAESATCLVTHSCTCCS